MWGGGGGGVEVVRRTRALMLETRSFWVRIALAPALSVFMYDI